MRVGVFPTGLALTQMLLLAGCTDSLRDVATSCRHMEGKPTLQVELLFGRDIAGQGQVSDAQWSEFLREEVTPRFPDGLTVLSAVGQWRDVQSGQVTRESSFILRIVTADAPSTLTQLSRIRLIYEQRFKQQSVGLTIAPICSSF